MDEVQTLTVSEAVPLAHTLAAHVAELSGCRVLFIKGPISDQDGLRPPRDSTDVDVWVDPADQASYLAALMEHGWLLRPTTGGPRILALHSVSLIHPAWPCDIDVHDSYPGLLEPDLAATFELLWRCSRRVEIAGRSLAAADLVGTAAVVALHALRDPDTPRSKHELDFLCDRLPDLLSETDRRGLQEFAAATWSMDTLGPLLERIGVTPPPRPADERYLPLLRDWDLRSTENSPTARWLVEIRRASWRRRPLVLLQALLLPGHLLSQLHPEVGSAPGERNRARLERLGRGIRALPRATLALIRTRRASRRSR